MNETRSGERDERRLHPRLRLPIAARYRAEPQAEWRQGQIRNLSASGAALRTAERLRVGSVLAPLHFQLPGEEQPLQVAAAVLRCQPEAGGEGASYRSGLHFLNLEGEPFERVRLFVFRGLRRS